MIPEREREALMRLTMCAREECRICKYEDKCNFEFQCNLATENMNILADALRVADTPQTDCEDCDKYDTCPNADKGIPQTDCAWQTENIPTGCSKSWSAACTYCERYFSCDYLSGRHTDCGWGEPNE